jgi:hypothetical protein
MCGKRLDGSGPHGRQQLIRIIAIKASIFNYAFSRLYGKVPQNPLVAVSIEIFAAG